MNVSPGVRIVRATMRRGLLQLAVASLCLACGGSGSSGGAGGSAGGASGGSAGAGATGTGAASGSGGAAGGGGGAGGSSCEPTTGTGHDDLYCDDIHVSVIERGSDKVLSVYGRILGTAPNADDCLVLDEVTLGDAPSPLQVISLSGAPTATGLSRVWFEVPAAAPVAELCADEKKRVEPFRFHAKGRMHGGTFSATCGATAGSSGWPPRVMMSCHRNVTLPPTSTSIEVKESSFQGQSFVFTSAYLTFPHLPGQGQILSVDGAIRIVPYTWGAFGGGPLLEPLDTDEWTAHISESTYGSGPATSVLLDAQKDQLGHDACPYVAPTTEPDPYAPPPPIFLARLTGSSALGPLTTEVRVDSCYRITPP